MSSSGQQEVLTASQGPNATTEGDSFLDRAYEYAGNVLSWIKYILKWSLVCEESRQKEQTQMEKIIGESGSDPTAPSDLQPVTETVMFDSATIMATLIITFCVFYFIDFFVQIFAGISGADISPSLASIPPVIPTRPRRRRRGSTSMSRESKETTVSTQSTLSRPDTTQGSESGSAAVPMKEILTKSFKSSKEPISAKREKSSSENTPTRGAKATPDRKLAGRSPLKNIHGVGDVKTMLKEEKDCNGGYGFDGEHVQCNCRRMSRAFTMRDEETQTECDVVTAEDYSNTDGASSIHTHYCTRNLKGYKRRTRDYVYDEDHGLPYADDLSGEEFSIYQYDKFKVRLGYEAQLEELRTEFSVDDFSEQGKALDEWDCRGTEVAYPEPPKPRHPLEVTMSEDELDSLYKTAENIFRKVAAHNHERGHSDNANGEGSNGEEECVVEIPDDAKNTIDGVELIASPPRRLLSFTDCNELGDGGTLENDIVEHALNNEATGDESFHIDDFDENQNDAEPDWEEPRDLDLSGSQDNRDRSEAFLRNGDTKLHECDAKTARSLSVFDVRQSLKLRRFHHVLFSYPDKHAEKVLLTGSFFGWKLSMPMQREGNVFRLSITLPAGEHKYRFQVFRRK